MRITRHHPRLARYSAIALTFAIMLASLPAGGFLIHQLIPTTEAATFSTGNLVIYRVGDGSAALTSTATAVFIDEYATSGGSAIQSIALPTSVTAQTRD